MPTGSSTRTSPRPTIPASPGYRWVHDYHLLLLPELLRQAGAQGGIGFFLHVPFPPPEVFSRLPWRTTVLEGMLGADIVSFHTARYRDNFLRTCRQLVDGVEIHGTSVQLRDGRVVRTAAHPISIDAADLAERARQPGVDRALAGLRKQFADRRLLLGVDRLDYTKGIPERLRAIELLLELRPDLRREITFVQVAVPSRGEIREYRELRAAVEQLVGRINGRFTEPGLDVPVHYLYRGVTPDRLLAYYRAAEICLVTPLQDGMNLVAKEYVTVQHATDGAGVLVLSEFTGAIEELPGGPSRATRSTSKASPARSASRSSSTRPTAAAGSRGWRRRSTATTSSPGSTRSWRARRAPRRRAARLRARR